MHVCVLKHAGMWAHVVTENTSRNVYMLQTAGAEQNGALSTRVEARVIFGLFSFDQNSSSRQDANV